MSENSSSSDLSSFETIIIGPGRVGSTLAKALTESGVNLKAQVSRDKHNLKALLSSDLQKLIFLTVPDDAIEQLVEELSHFICGQGIALHCSGGNSEAVLAPLAEKGYHTGVFHPCRPISRKEESLPRDGSMAFTFSGSPQAELLCASLAKSWSAQFIVLGEIDRLLYHAGLVLTAGHVVAMLIAAEQALRASGLDSAAAKQVAYSVFRGVSEKASGELRQALTGPFVRGDEALIKKESEKLQAEDQLLADVYNVVGNYIRRESQV